MAFIDKIINKDWTVRQIIAQDGIVLPQKYFYKRKEALSLYLSSKLAARLAGYTLIEKDLRSAIVWLGKIDDLIKEAGKGKGIQISADRETYNVVKGFWVASLTFYGKSFCVAEGRRIKLERDIVDKEHQELHDRFMHMRHNFAAHGGKDSYEEVRVALVMVANKKSPHPPVLFTELYQQDYSSWQEENDLLLLAEHVHKKVEQRIEELRSKILEKEILPLGKEYWYNKAVGKKLAKKTKS